MPTNSRQKNPIAGSIYTPSDKRKRRHKYGVAAKEDRTWNGIVFASKAEMIRCKELSFCVKCKTIATFSLQPKFDLAGIKYVADFLVTDFDGKQHAEDVKGVETPVFKIKKRLWKIHGTMPLVLLKRKGTTWKREIIERTQP